MITEKRLKYIFLLASAFLLIFMLITGKNAGISCDEILHYNHSQTVYNYFASEGKDVAALNTPVNNLKYYGQSYDNIVTIIIRWLGIEDVYSFRHIMSSFAGWLAIFITALFAAWISGYRSSLLVIFLFAISPTFMGHAQNNLKDIPFALGYISSLYLMFRLLFGQGQFRFPLILLLVISLAFTISIRAGGLLLVCYLFLFFFILTVLEYVRVRKIDRPWTIRKTMILILATVASFYLSILLWPFALQSPIKNVFASLHFMSNFPGTFREIFEGKAQWTDFMPWYYLPKYMLITIPVVVFAGVVSFFAFSGRVVKERKVIEWLFILFAIIFPVLYVIFNRSNIYSGWRQFLFLYPPVILVAASGFNQLFEISKSSLLKAAFIILLLLLAINPVKFMAENKNFWYLYYNQIPGGSKGAYGNYETDYYYTGQTIAASWLADFLEKNKKDTVIVAATYPADWHFRKLKNVKTTVIRYEERSQSDWDYAIITNRYINPFQLKNKKWPPSNTVYTVEAGDIPICAVLKRTTKKDFSGYTALEEGRNSDAERYLGEALKVNCNDEMIFYNFARALCNEGKYESADSLLKKGLELNPYSESILMYLGNISAFRNDSVVAGEYYRKLIGVNRKYLDAYVSLARLEAVKDTGDARKLLTECLGIDPCYKPAVKELADSYRKSDPETAAKYDNLLNSLK